MMQPQVIIIAGPNGAGKSTSAPPLVPPGVPYINADEIAKGLSDLKPAAHKDIEASGLLLREWDRVSRKRADFAIETTLVSRSLAPKIRKRQQAGYRFLLYFFWLPVPDLSIARVAARVRMGGHHIPEDVIRRRYEKGLSNFFGIYQSLADAWKVYSNLRQGTPVFVAEGQTLQTTNVIVPRFGIRCVRGARWTRETCKRRMLTASPYGGQRNDLCSRQSGLPYWNTRERATPLPNGGTAEP